MSTFHERKQQRAEYFLRLIHGWRRRPCTACAGSGYCDSFGSPPCGACDGTGKELVPPAAASSAQRAQEGR